MVTHTCEICLKKFNKKSTYDYHINNKKKPCKPIIQGNSDQLQKAPKSSKNAPKSSEFAPNFSDQLVDSMVCLPSLSCEHCGKYFSKKFNLNRHLNNNRCKIVQNKIKTNEEENKKLKIEIENLKKMFAEFTKKNKNKQNIQSQNNSNNSINSNSNNTNNIQTQNNQNINIILPYGKELEKIELNEVLDHMLTLDFKDMLQNLVKYIYLNDAKPENKNFVVNDLARNKCQYYDGEKWITSKANDEILKIFENANSLFTDPFDRIEIEKTIEFIRKNKKYSEKYSTILKCKNYALSLFDETDKENIEKREELLSELKFIFYSHKDEILKIKL